MLTGEIHRVGNLTRSLSGEDQTIVSSRATTAIHNAARRPPQANPRPRKRGFRREVTRRTTAQLPHHSTTHRGTSCDEAAVCTVGKDARACTAIISRLHRIPSVTGQRSGSPSKVPAIMPDDASHWSAIAPDMSQTRSILRHVKNAASNSSSADD